MLRDFRNATQGFALDGSFRFHGTMQSNCRVTLYFCGAKAFWEIYRFVVLFRSIL